MLLKLLISLDLAFADQIFSISWVFTGRNEVLAKVIFSQACVKNSVHRGGVPDQAPPPGPGRYPPPPGPGRYPPGPDTPPDQAGTPLPPDQAGTPPDQTPPQTMQVPPGPGRYPHQTRQVPPGPDTPPDQAGTPPGPDTTPGTRPPPPNSRLRDTVNVRPVRILLECILVFWEFGKIVS